MFNIALSFLSKKSMTSIIFIVGVLWLINDYVLQPQKENTELKEKTESLEKNITHHQVDAYVDISNAILEIESNRTQEIIDANTRAISSIFENNTTYDASINILDRVFLYSIPNRD